MCLFGLRISRVPLQASHRLPTLSRTFIAGSICLTKNKILVFHPGACMCDTWLAMWVTHGMPCVNMHCTLEGYIRGVPIQGSKEKEDEGKREREERKGEMRE